MAVVSYPGTPGTVLYGGMPTPSGGTTLTTITLANTSATEQSAGFVTPMFGLPLKQGDVPAGQYPAFELADGTPVPATIHSVTSWPDGSMKWCGVFLRVPTTVAGSGSLAITVKNGGSAPGSSARAVSDLTAADLKVELTGVTNLTGTWTASINDAITNGTVVVIGDGPAGMLVRILGDFKQSGSAHGQLVAWHYALIAQNSSGGLLGIRYLGRVAQPWADVSSPTPTRRVVNAVLKVGASTLRTLQGCDTTETVGANIGFGHYTSFFTVGTDGKWDFVQGGGSASADCTVRVVHDNGYLVRSLLVPPYDLQTVTDSSESTDYYPYGIGPYGSRNIDATGNSNFIGVLPAWAVRHLINQTASDERAVRVGGLVAAGWRATLRDSASREIVPVVDIQASYSGLGTIQTSWRYTGTNRIGVQVPADTSSLWSGDTNTSHRGSAAYYPYLITGEPQYADLLQEHAAQAIMGGVPSTGVLNTADPLMSLYVGEGGDRRNMQVGTGGTVYKGGGLAWANGNIRASAWAFRDVGQAFAILSDASPAKPYFGDVMTSAANAVLALNAARPVEWQNTGMYLGNAASYIAADVEIRAENPWQYGYYALSIAHLADITKNASVASFRGQWGKFYKSLQDVGALTQATAYRMLQFNADGSFILDATKFLFLNGSDISFSASSNFGTVLDAWSPTNGDEFAFFSNVAPEKPFPEATDGTRFYAVNCSGKTFQLSATPGGSPIDVPTDVTVTAYMARVQNFEPKLYFNDQNYVGIMYAAIRHMFLAGDTSLSAAKAKIDASVTGIPVSFTANPRNAIADAYPE